MNRPVDDLCPLVAEWPGEWHALGVATDTEILGAAGDLDRIAEIASVSKLFTAVAALIAVEEGTIALDEPAGPPGSTVRHLLAHASGLGFDDHAQLFPAGRRRVYSNVGIEVLADHIAKAADMPFIDYLRDGVIDPLGLAGFDATGSPAHGMLASVRHLVRLGQELLTPTLLSAATIAQATTPSFPDLRGVLPGFGAIEPNLWGLGFEIRGAKEPHWTSPDHSPETFGHFGGAGSFLWVDPRRRLVGATVGSEPFDMWAVSCWPETNTRLLERYG